jgi:hypothetical protein
MKRTRRVSVQIEHREVSITFTLIEPRVADPVFPDSEGPIPQSCPICGAPWVFVNPNEGSTDGSHIEDVASAFSRLSLHPAIFAGGMFLICRQSFDQLRDKP